MYLDIQDLWGLLRFPFLKEKDEQVREFSVSFLRICDLNGVAIVLILADRHLAFGRQLKVK